MGPETRVAIFRSRLREGAEGLHAELMGPVGRAAGSSEGLLGYVSYVSDGGERVTIARFDSQAALDRWGADPTHRAAMARADEVYAWYELDVTTPVAETRSGGLSDEG